MALVRISCKTLCKLSGIRQSQIEPTLTSLGIPLEGWEGDNLLVEITPNRPDWLSVEGIARSCFSFVFGKPKSYSAMPAKVNFFVEHSVLPARPILGSAIVRNVRMDEEMLESLIQLQEKLHETLGRGRKKMAIGLHDMRAIRPPFTYKAVGREEVRFVPLGKSSSMSLGQILLEHEKGREYSHLVGDLCPLIVDADSDVLSFPPIINAERTRVTLSTEEILIDCTGTSEEAVKITVNILCAALADRGGVVEEVKINSTPYKLFKPYRNPIPYALSKKLLGVDLSHSSISHHLACMGHNVVKSSVLSPSFRADIIGEIDLVEDIAISIGYNKLSAQPPPFSSIGFVDDALAPLHEAAIGLGYFEVLSWILTNSSTLQRSHAQGPALRISNPLTEEFSVIRPWIYPNLIEILSRSKSQPLPIYLYEIGPVLEPSKGPSSSTSLDFVQSEHFAAISMHPKSSFSEAWSHLQGIAQAIGAKLVLKEEDLDGFIGGRCAKILLPNQIQANSSHPNSKPSNSSNYIDIGIIGELHPVVLEAFGLEQPVALFELRAKDFVKKGK